VAATIATSVFVLVESSGPGETLLELRLEPGERAGRISLSAQQSVQVWAKFDQEVVGIVDASDFAPFFVDLKLESPGGRKTARQCRSADRSYQAVKDQDPVFVLFSDCEIATDDESGEWLIEVRRQRRPDAPDGFRVERVSLLLTAPK